MSDKKNQSLEEKQQLAEAVYFKKVSRNINIRRCVGKCTEKSYREIGMH